MKIRFSLLNNLFLLMFWGPFLCFLSWRIINDFSSLNSFLDSLSHDDYSVHLMAIFSGSFLVFVLLTGLYFFFDFWGKLSYWKRYGLIMGIYILSYFFIIYLANLLVDLLDIPTSCPGGSPILIIAGLFIFYIPVGFVWTLIVSLAKGNICD